MDTTSLDVALAAWRIDLEVARRAEPSLNWATIQRGSPLWDHALGIARLALRGVPLTIEQESLALSSINSMTLNERDNEFLLFSASKRHAEGTSLPGNPIANDDGGAFGRRFGTDASDRVNAALDSAAHHLRVLDSVRQRLNRAPLRIVFLGTNPLGDFIAILVVLVVAYALGKAVGLF